MRIALSLAIAVSVAVPSVTPAKDGARITIGAIRNDKKGAAARQLAGVLCDRHPCVPVARAKRGKKIDFAAARAAGIQGIVVGIVYARRGTPLLDVALLTSSFTPAKSWTLRLDVKGRPTRAAVESLADDVDRLLAARAPGAPAPRAGAAAPPPRAAEPVRPPPRAAEPARPPAAGAPTSEAPARPPAAAPDEVEQRPSAAAPGRTRGPRPPPAEAPGRGRPTPATPSRAAGPPRAPIARIDLGVHLFQRKLSYSGVGPSTGTLQKFSADAVLSPRLRLALHPLATRGGLASGLGILGGYEHSIGLKVKNAGGTKHDAAQQAWDLGAGWRLPLGASGAALTPRVAYRAFDLTVSAAGGSKIAGLPDAKLRGFRMGVDLEVPLVARAGLLAGGGYTIWTSKRDLVGSGGFFSSGSASAFDVEVGVDVRLSERLSVPVLLEYERTSYSLKGTSIYAATGATDSSLGGVAALRLSL